VKLTCDLICDCPSLQSLQPISSDALQWAPPPAYTSTSSYVSLSTPPQLSCRAGHGVFTVTPHVQITPAMPRISTDVMSCHTQLRRGTRYCREWL